MWIVKPVAALHTPPRRYSEGDVLDYENDLEFTLLDIHVGTMLEEYIGLKGHSTYG